jgi:polyhydroxybutyrate depolymerase
MRSPLLLSAFFVAGACALVACSNGSGGPSGMAGTTGAAGTTSMAGTTGAAGTAGTTSAAGTTGSAGTMATGGTTGTAGTGGTMATGGTTGSAGTGGAMSAGGTTGSAGAGGATGTGGSMVVGMSAGCGKENGDASNKWTAHNIMVTVPAKYTAAYNKRLYWTRPPAAYQPTKPYTLIIWGQGCGLGLAPDMNIPPTENPLAAANSVIVELDPSQSNPTGKTQCFSAGPDGDNVDSPELLYFDQILSEVEAEFCIDKSKVFMGGYSSGGWFSSLMSCNRTSVIRGTGWAAAGLQKNHDACVGPVAALITRDNKDNGTPADQTMQAVENIRMRNGCAATTKPWTPTWSATEMQADTSSCLSYDGCMAGYPLVFCPTNLGQHTNTEGDTHLTRFGLWKLWTSL